MRHLSLVERQPVAVRAAVIAVVVALVHVAVALGWITTDQEATIVGAVDAIAAVVAILWARAAVTPNAKVVARVTTGGEVVAGDASTVPTGETLEAISPSPGSLPEVNVPVDPARLAA